MKTFHVCYFTDSKEYKVMLTGVNIHAKNMMDALTKFLNKGIEAEKISYIKEFDNFNTIPNGNRN